MHYHTVSDEEWIKRKDEIVETLGYYQNNVIQPITQRESFLFHMKGELSKLLTERMQHSWWERAFSKHNEVLAIDRKIAETRAYIRDTEAELNNRYQYMFQKARKMQEHWFDLVGIGYGNVEPRLTDEDFERLDKRWAEAHPDEEID